MVRKKSAGRTNIEKSYRPVSAEEPVPLQSINPLAIEVYNPKNISLVESTVSTESDTFDEDQQVEENPDDEDTSNVVGNKNFVKKTEDGEVPNKEEISNEEENPTVEENSLSVEAESEEIDVDIFVAEILAKAQEESSAGSLKRQKMMAKKNIPSWYPPRPSSKVVPPPIK